MNIRKHLIKLCGVALSLALLAGCGTNGGSQLPSTSQANLSKNVLQLAVGTANIGQDGTIGLNVVATLRQPNGVSGVAADMPTLTMPSGMLVPPGTPGAYTGLVQTAGANVDAGTNHISGSPQVPLNNANLVNSTLGTFTGVYTYGFGPLNSDQNTSSIGAYYIGVPNNSGGNGFTSSSYFFSNSVLAALGVADPTQPLPFFSSDPMDYVVGSPAVPFFNNGKFPIGFAGYPAGFTVFELAPAAGNYMLTAHVAAANVAPVDYTATATLASTTPLGPTSVTFTGDATGGGSGTVSVPAGVTETEVFLIDISSSSGAATYYTVGPLTGTGTVNYTLPDNLGACTTNCPQPSMVSGDTVVVAAVGYDYPAFEAGPPGNTTQKPVIAGANGQADITMSPIVTQPY